MQAGAGVMRPWRRSRGGRIVDDDLSERERGRSCGLVVLVASLACPGGEGGILQSVELGESRSAESATPELVEQGLLAALRNADPLERVDLEELVIRGIDR